MKGSAALVQIMEPYAEALMALATSQNMTEQIGNEAIGVQEALESSPELSAFLASPVYAKEQKKAVIRQLFDGKIHTYFLSFLLLLVDKQRIDLTAGICDRYRALLRDLNKAVLAEVTSTVDLNDAQRQSIVEQVKGMTGAQSVELKTTLDPELIGGVVIKVGSQVIDASLRGQLRRIGLALGKS
jgi:F-type H+-transporting ATPase subunit delta